MMTCSGGDSSAGADEAARYGIEFPPLAAETVGRLRELVPPAATIANPLDYTAVIWGERGRLRDIIATVANDPSIARLLIFYDEPELTGDPKLSWDAVREGILDGAAASTVPVVVSSTLPELLQDESAIRMVEAGVPAIAGLRSGIACAAALGRPQGDSARLREIAAVARRRSVRPEPRDLLADRAPGAWLSEHDAKALLREAGIPVVPGRVAADADDAVTILVELGPPVAAKLSGEGVRHKSDLGALALDLHTEDELRSAHERLIALGEGDVLVERLAAPGVELLVAAQRDGVVPSLVVGLGGVWTETLDDAAIVPLPAGPERVERALRRLRGASLLTGGRGRPELDVATAAAVAAAAGELLLSAELDLLELNPVVVYEDGAVVVDALGRASIAAAPTPSSTAVSR